MSTDNLANSESIAADWEVAGQPMQSRLIMGSGRFDHFEVMRQALQASECQLVTVAVRREKIHDDRGRNILDHLDLGQYRLLPNTAGCYDVETAVRCARMGREILRGLGVDNVNWVKLEVLGDSQTLLPDPWLTLQATEKLVAEDFQVFCYTSDDAIQARRLQAAGAVAVMPAGSPIGSGLGILNEVAIQNIVEDLKSRRPGYPVIVDAGIGTASDAARALELGCDAVLLNSAVARAKNPVKMADSMRLATRAGRLSFESGRIVKSRFASASSPEIGVISSRPAHNQ